MNISAVLVVRNAQSTLRECLQSLSWVKEIVVVDMESTDKTKSIAKSFNARIYNHPNVSFADPARNFAIDKATCKWIFMIDADEKVGEYLADALQISRQIDFVRIPRKNILFGKWIKHGMWWPDYQIRFFCKGSVSWQSTVHTVPQTNGIGMDLPPEEQYAIVHQNYNSISQFIDRMNRYTTLQANEYRSSHKEFLWSDMIKAPFKEFLRRYFASKGYEDGLHGLALALLQAFSEFVLMAKVWERHKFPEKNQEIMKSIPILLNEMQTEFGYWTKQTGIRKNSFLQKIKQFIT